MNDAPVRDDIRHQDKPAVVIAAGLRGAARAILSAASSGKVDQTEFDAAREIGETLGKGAHGVLHGELVDAETGKPLSEDDTKKVVAMLAGDVPAELLEQREYTRDEYIKAYKDPATPDAVRKALKKYLYPDNAEPIKPMGIHTHPQRFIGGKTVLRPMVNEIKQRKPEGMSGRQWKRERKKIKKWARNRHNEEGIQQGDDLSHNPELENNTP